ncbi:hypothetical protein [Yimella lutea]|nr:hypothetical protein [Yimella lutea]
MRRVTSRPAVRRGARAMLVAGVASTALSGCYYFSEPTTDMDYVASDGNNAEVGTVNLSNVLIVTKSKGDKGSMQGLATNNGNTAAQLTVTPAGGQPTKVSIPPMQSVRLDGKPSGDGKATVSPIDIPATPVPPGESTTVVFATADGGSKRVSVPVVLDQPPYGSEEVTHPGSRPDDSAEKGDGGGH